MNNNQVKMSDFLNKKRIVIIDGEATVVEPKVNGEIEVNTFNAKIVERIQKEVFNKLTDEEIKNDKIFTYNAFPILTNIQNDITIEQFEELMETPRRPFSLILNMVTDEINNIFDAMKDYKNMDSKLNKIKNENEEIFKQIEQPVKTKEEQLEDLYKELQNNFSNREKRDEILNKINVLRG